MGWCRVMGGDVLGVKNVTCAQKIVILCHFFCWVLGWWWCGRRERGGGSKFLVFVLLADLDSPLISEHFYHTYVGSLPARGGKYEKR